SFCGASSGAGGGGRGGAIGVKSARSAKGPRRAGAEERAASTTGSSGGGGAAIGGIGWPSVGATDASIAVPLATMIVSAGIGSAAGVAGMRGGGGDVDQSIVAGPGAEAAGAAFSGFQGPDRQASGAVGPAAALATLSSTAA